MPRFLIEIQHEEEHDGCTRSLSALTKYGSHLVTHTEYGCDDGIHAGWFIVDVDNRADAHLIVPPQLRADARIVQLRKWTRKQIEARVEDLVA